MKVRLYRTLAASETGLTEEELARRVLMSRGVSPRVGRRILGPLLRHEQNFVREETGLWRTRVPQDPRERLLDTVTLAVVDLETSGRLGAQDEITEVGAVKMRGGEWLEEFYALVNPGRYVSPAAGRLTGISAPRLPSARAIDDVMGDLSLFCKGTVLVAHNLSFDLRLLRREASRLGLPLPELRICTYGLRSYRLEDLTRRLGLPREHAHHALPDARSTARMFRLFVQRLEGEGVETLGDLLRFQQRSRGRAELRFDRRVVNNLPGGPGLVRFSEADGTLLYETPARNLRQEARTILKAPWAERWLSRAATFRARPTTSWLRALCLARARFEDVRAGAGRRPCWLRLVPGVPVPGIRRAARVGPVRREGIYYLGPFRDRRHREEVLLFLAGGFPARKLRVV